MAAARYEVWSRVPASPAFVEVTTSATVTRFEKATGSADDALDCLRGLRAVGLDGEIRRVEEERPRRRPAP